MTSAARARTLRPMTSLTPEEARVLGCLMEKAVTTPDNYPLSLNALVTACNQTTNRDPIVHYSEETVDRTLESLREKELSRRVKATGQRVVKHRHVAEEALGLDDPSRGARRAVAARRADAGRAQAAHRALARVPFAGRRRRSVGPARRRAEFTVQLAAPARAEGIAMDAAARAAEPEGAGRRTARAPCRPRRRHARAEPEAEPRASQPRARAAALARGPQSRDRRGHAVGRGHRSRARSTRRSNGHGARSRAWAARPVRRASRGAARVRDLLETRGRRVRGAHDAARWASRSSRRATRSARCSSASTGTSSTSGEVIAPRTVTSRTPSRSASPTSRSASSRT